MRSLPTGTVTFLFTDIEGSTSLLHELGTRYADVLAHHHRLLRAVWASHGGVEVDTAGDAFFVAFERAEAACAAALAAQAALAPTPVRLRIGLHTGRPLLGETGYVGIDVHRAARIAAVAHGGQIVLSRETRDLAGVDAENLGLHRLKDLREAERLFQLGDGTFPPLRSLYASNLPAPVNELVGRAQEVGDVARALRGDSRLVTLTGAGGSGKTRLALAVGAELTPELPDGVWFVPLASVTDPAVVEQYVAQTLGMRGRVDDELRGKRMLLVLDNLEQVLDAGPRIGALVALAPGLRVLATSRERLGIRGEREHQVGPLAEGDGTALFLARAADVGVELQATPDVAELVRALDGLPLALELAAARTRLMPPDQILERLTGGLDVLSGAPRDAPARQRTLRATIEWSHSLLSADEAAVFSRLAVFPGSFDLRAATEVAAADLDDLGALVDKSLVARRRDRYFLLETIRQFAIECALADGCRDELLRRHAAYYSDLAAMLDPGTRDGRQRSVVATLRREQPNLRQALATLESAPDPLPFARLVGSLAYFWYLSGRFAEGIGAAERALERLRGLEVPEAGTVANAIALLSALRGDAERAGELGAFALEIGRRFDDAPTILRALTCRGNALAARHEWSAFLDLMEELRRAAEAANDPWMRALAIVNSGVGRRELGRLADARADLDRALELVSALGDPDLTVGTLCNAGHVDLRLGDLDAARRRFRKALELTRDQPLGEATIWSLDALAAVDVRDGFAERAARLLGAAEGLAAATGYGLPGTRDELQRTRAAVEEALGFELAGVLRAEGAALDAAAAIDLALAEPVLGVPTPRLD